MFVASPRALLWAALLWGAVAAAVDPKEYQAPPPVSEHELQEMKESSKSSLTSYGKDTSNKTEPLPWAAIGLGVLTVVAAGPFLWRAYRSTAKELEESGPVAKPQPGPDPFDG